MVRHAAERYAPMRPFHGQPGIDFQIWPPNPQPRGVPNGRPRTCYHGWYPGICNKLMCRLEMGPWPPPHQPLPLVYVANGGGHGHPLHGGMMPPHPHHPHHGELHHHPHGGMMPPHPHHPHHGGLHHHHHGGFPLYSDYYEEDEDDDEDAYSVFSGSGMSLGGHPMLEPYYGHGGFGPYPSYHHGGHGHYGGAHIPLSYGPHHGHGHPRSLGSVSTSEQSY